MKKVMLFVLLMLTVLISQQSFAFDGLVTLVHDGDTLTVINESKNPEIIRLFRIDSPEMKGAKWAYQPYASEARTALLNLCVGKIATVVRKGTSYNRTVGSVSCEGVDVATYQVANGNAWVYRYTPTKALKTLQVKAKASGLGLWSSPNPVEPYLWRNPPKTL